MTAVSKAWVTIADTAVDPDSPVDAALMTGLRDNAVHLREWLGASYTGGAVQDHNHDGVNSAAIQIGANMLRNGSFEDGTGGWTTTAYTGGTIATNTANDMDGATALAFTSTAVADGGGDAVSNEFIPVTGGAEYLIAWSMKASASGISSKVEVQWFDDAQSLISSTTVFSSTSTNTTAKTRQRIAAAPATARYAKAKLTGGVPATGSATGTVYFDGVQLGKPIGSMILLDTVDGAGAGSMDFVEGIDATFDRYVVLVDDLRPNTDGTTIATRVSSDLGATYKSGATDYLNALTGGSNNGIFMTVLSDISNVSYQNGFWRIEFSNPASSTIEPAFLVSGAYMRTTTGGMIAVQNAARYNTATLTVNALRVLPLSGTLVMGIGRLYGVRKGV